MKTNVKNIRISIASASVLGLNDSKPMIRPSTIYLLQGDVCSGLCSFCPMSCQFTQKSMKRVSRVTWPEISMSDLLASLKNTPDDIERICLQCVRGFEDEIVQIIETLKKNTQLPLSVSVYVNDLEFIDRLVQAGAQRIGIAIDAANEDVFSIVKKGDFKKRVSLIKRAAKRFKGRVTSHIIVGMGESERDVFELIKEFYKNGVTTGLFAFTPVRGTDMEDHPEPDFESYRRLQVVRYLFHNNLEKAFVFTFDDENSVDIAFKDPNTRVEIDFYDLFRTSGCPGCNRPFYNESPGKRPYNFAEKPQKKSLLLELESLKLSFICQLNIFHTI